MKSYRTRVRTYAHLCTACLSWCSTETEKIPTILHHKETRPDFPTPPLDKSEGARVNGRLFQKDNSSTFSVPNTDGDGSKTPFTEPLCGYTATCDGRACVVSFADAGEERRCLPASRLSLRGFRLDNSPCSVPARPLRPAAGRRWRLLSYAGRPGPRREGSQSPPPAVTW